MKKIILVFAVFFIAQANAQIINGGFENWTTDTAFFAGYSGIVAGDTFTYMGPSNWTSANGISGAASLGSNILVTQSANFHSGNYAVQLTTDTLTTITLPNGLGERQLTVPGLILNGTFSTDNITQNILLGGTISPADVPGAGQPFTQALDSFTGYYQYTPVYDTFTQSMDTCVLWATLRNGSTIVANAEFKSQTNTGGSYVRFSVPFVYLTCDMPDTLVILLASSIPKFSGILSGSTELDPGSVLLVDDLGYDTLASDVNFVFAKNDAYTVNRGDADTLDVLANDTSCNSSALTVSITTGPAHGTDTVLSDGRIVYTASSTYSGPDSLYYTDTDPSHVSSSAWAKFNVIQGVGISEVNNIQVKIYPVPATDEVHFQFENKGRTTARIYDVVGNLVSVATFTQNDNTISVSNLANGLYSVQLLDENNTVIARTKFVVTK